MTEKRMYYDCPIEAMYMTKNFGVILAYEDCKGNKFPFMKAFLYTNELQNFIDELSDFAPFYIAKESEHIFEPAFLHGDIAKNEVCVFRNGKQFFTPKTEDISND